MISTVSARFDVKSDSGACTGRNFGAGVAIRSPEEREIADSFSGMSARRFGS